MNDCVGMCLVVLDAKEIDTKYLFFPIFFPQ